MDPTTQGLAISCSSSSTLCTTTVTTTITGSIPSLPPLYQQQSASTPCLNSPNLYHPSIIRPPILNVRPHDGQAHHQSNPSLLSGPSSNMNLQEEQLQQQSRIGSYEDVFSQESNLSQHNQPRWQVVSTNKRKNQSNDQSIKIKIVKTNQDPITNRNYYKPLEAMDQDHDNNTTTSNTAPTQSARKADPPPPPVFIHGVVNYQAMISNVATVLAADNYICRSLANNVVKINPKSIDSYRELVKHLRKENIVFHTYQAKQDKAYRVVIRHIHHSVPTTDIKTELELQGFKVRNVVNVLKRNTKEPLNVFFVDLEPADNNKKIFDLQYLMHIKIGVEPPRKNISIAQCTRCQNYGHTKAYCTRPFACVKCGGNHTTASCAKTKDTPANCALCDGPHPANYRGCTVYKDIQNLRSNQPNQIQAANYLQQTNNPTLTTSRTPPLQTRSSISPNVSFAQVASQNTNQQQNRMDNQNNSDQITLSTFLQEFKTMFNQLFTQNNMILNLLNNLVSKLVSK